ncbi:MAG TPA: hypothetical protein VKP60_02105 [Magnetospirillaceae bacterium]|nr:hypothetical protein [Magnetospirillaceae bacterium]
MRRLTGILGAIALSVAFCATLPARAEDCPIIDLMPAYWQLVESTQSASDEEKIARFRAALVTPNGSLYGADGLGFTDAAKLDKAILRSFAHADHDRPAIERMGRFIQGRMPLMVREFRRSFPDFRCDFPIYLLPSLGQMDGAGRQIDGQPALLFGVEVIAATHTEQNFPVFADHELFHRYHYQAAGMSDDVGPGQAFWKALWAEGLATYVSLALNPGTSLDVALFDDKIVPRANEHFPALLGEIQADFDDTGAEPFSRFFMGSTTPGLYPPPRSGYYFGALTAQALAKTLTLEQLAHLSPPDARARILTVLPGLTPALP